VHAAIGFRDHSGWAIAIAIGLELGGTPVLLERSRLTICPDNLPRQPYHAVAERGFPRDTIRLVEEAALGSATDELARLRETLSTGGHDVVAAGIGHAAGSIPASLEAILRTHTLLHAAEGRLFREALAEAAAEIGLAVSRFLQRDVMSLAASALDAAPTALDAHLTAIGKGAGPPWRKDHREAAAAAIIALSGSR